MKIISARKGSGRPVTDEVFEVAVARGKRLYGSTPRATAVRFDRNNRNLEIDFQNRDPFKLSISRLKDLASLTDDQLSRLSVGFAGKGLYLDEADLHVSIQGLIDATKDRKKHVLVISRDVLQKTHMTYSKSHKGLNVNIFPDDSERSDLGARMDIGNKSILQGLPIGVFAKKKTLSK